MQTKDYEDAIVHGLAARRAAEAVYNLEYEFKAVVAIAQANFLLQNLNEAQTYFQAAQYLAFVSPRPRPLS